MLCKTQDAEAAMVEVRRGGQGPEMPGVSMQGMGIELCAN
jgi:hypothetical protein